MKENFEIPSSNTGAGLDSSDAFRSDYLQSVFRSPLLTNSEASVARVEAPPMPPGISAPAWEQVSQWISSGSDVNFTTADSGQVPDYILGADGQLTPNPAKTTPSPDGKITVQVEPGPGQENAKKAAQDLQVAAIEYKIALWQQANPGKDVPHFLKSMLSSARNTGGTDTPAPEQQPQQQAPQPQMEAPQAPAPRPSYGGGGGGGGRGGGGGQRLGDRNIGNPGFRDGNFEPNGPIDRNAIPPPVPGDLPIKMAEGQQPSCTPDQIQEFLEKMGSPAAKEEGFSKALYDACVERQIDPAVAVGFFLQESTLGRYGRAHENKSLGNIKGVSPESGQTDGTFRRYQTWAEGARDWARLIDESYVGKRGLESLSQVISVYAPSSDGNNEQKYVHTVKGVVENFKNQNRTMNA